MSIKHEDRKQRSELIGLIIPVMRNRKDLVGFKKIVDAVDIEEYAVTLVSFKDPITENSYTLPLNTQNFMNNDDLDTYGWLLINKLQERQNKYQVVQDLLTSVKKVYEIKD